MLHTAMKEISYTREALKALKRMPNNVQSQVRRKIEQYADDPQTLANNVKALKGSPYIRLRVGDWRVIMHDDRVLSILKIGPRGGVYE